MGIGPIYIRKFPLGCSSSPEVIEKTFPEMQVHGHGRDIYVEGKRVCMEMGAPSNMV
jgi:hypothetical protein